MEGKNDKQIKFCEPDNWKKVRKRNCFFVCEERHNLCICFCGAKLNQRMHSSTPPQSGNDFMFLSITRIHPSTTIHCSLSLCMYINIYVVCPCVMHIISNVFFVSFKCLFAIYKLRSTAEQNGCSCLSLRLIVPPTFLVRIFFFNF
jgi:hypothetical protein